jgi:hypothetical protein
MTTRRFAAVLLVAIAAEAGVFAFYYDDLIYLHKPVAELAARSAETFERHATHALTRDRLTRRHLETMASAAQTLGLHRIEVAALERRATDDPADRQVRLRLGDALRRTGDFKAAEAVYLDLLRSTERELAR